VLLKKYHIVGVRTKLMYNSLGAFRMVLN